MMPFHVNSSYLEEVAKLSGNEEQKAAFESNQNCVVIAGPGSGKTKTLVLKLARILDEDVQFPQHVACITYSNECVREIRERLEALGVVDVKNLFVGTVHSFCLNHILKPYAELAGLPINFPIKVATQKVIDRLQRESGVELFGINHPHSTIDLNKHRRLVIDRTSNEWYSNEELSKWTELYESRLHAAQLIDFEDIVIFGQQLVSNINWVLKLMTAKFPVIAVDEYQDLGVSLHRMVERLVFSGGSRLFAVGDADQSIYGFTGADGELLNHLASRDDIKKIRLSLNYRSASKLIMASEIVLQEKRGYKSSNQDSSAELQFIKCEGGLEAQAKYIVNDLIPSVLDNSSSKRRKLGDIAILYRAAKHADEVVKILEEKDIEYIRVDNKSPYRSVGLTNWIEDCALWVAGGWKIQKPTLYSIRNKLENLQNNRLTSIESRELSVNLTDFLLARRDINYRSSQFVTEIYNEFLKSIKDSDSSLADQFEEVTKMVNYFNSDESADFPTVQDIGRESGDKSKLNLLTLHSSKGREYDVVIMIGLDTGYIPWEYESDEQLRESRRLFYVGFTRARTDVYLLYSGYYLTKNGYRKNCGRSRFVDELAQRLDEQERIF